MSLRHFIYLFAGLLLSSLPALAEDYDVRGRVIDKLSRRPVAYANVALYGHPGKGASTDTTGTFRIANVAPGIYQLSVTCVGYKNLLSPEYIVSAQLPPIELELEEDASQLAEVTIPIGYRNDLIVRGGSPSENRFYLDGIEIPNINHFATQGASGGPVSILNADLIREVQFYTGAFPVDKAGALSSVMDIRLRDGNPDEHTFKATLGASEVSLSGAGHCGKRTTYLFSIRQSYLQLLFKMLGLPFLPNYVDGQFKIKTRLTDKDELILLGLTGIDNMKLNTDEKGEDAEYMLSYLPRIKQQTFTLGAAYKHYAGRHVQSVSIGYNYLGNQNLKYRNNDDSSPENLTLDLSAHEQKATLRAENRTYGERWTWLQGAEVYYARYDDHTFQRLYQSNAQVQHRQQTALGIVGWSGFASARYRTEDNRLTTTLGLRLDGSNYSSRMARFWENLSPNLSVSYRFRPAWALNAAAGLYHQLPSYTALGFKDNNGAYANKSLKYMRVPNANLGMEWNVNERLVLSAEGFYKHYSRIPLSVADGIPLACKGNDYGVVGNNMNKFVSI